MDKPDYLDDDELLAAFVNALELIAPSGRYPPDAPDRLLEALRRAIDAGEVDANGELTEAGWQRTEALLKMYRQ